MTLADMLVEQLPLLRKHATRLCRGNTDVAEDVLQDACVTILRSKTEPGDAGGNWMFGHVRYAMFHRYKAETKHAHDDHETAPDVYVDGAQEFALELSEISGVLATLTPGRREAFRMVAIDGWNTNEAAEILGVSRQAVHTRYAAAMDAIRAA